MDDYMNVIRHDYKHEQFQLACRSQVMKTVDNHSLNHILAEKMNTSHCVCSDKIEVIGVKVWFNRHTVSSMLSQGLRSCG